MFAKLGQSQGSLSSVDIHQVPKVNHDRYTNREESEDTNVLDGDDAAQRHTRQQEPLPPFPSKRNVSLFVEANVRKHRERHEENERSIEEDQTRLTNVGVVKKHKTGGSDAGG